MSGTKDVTRPEGQRWIRPMTARRPDDPHRAATPLELFFDLVFVVAIAQASAGLHHAIVGGHAIDGTLGFVLSFFGIWWAWMNFSWFASAYDTDDVPYRLLVLVQLTGALIFAAGLPRLAEFDLTVGTIGYVVMRIAMIVQWLRAAQGDPDRRRTALRYASGIAIVQMGWLALLLAPPTLIVPGFAFLALAELAVPAWAESAARTPWHPAHIAERYGLLTIIVLGESVLAATMAMQTALADGQALLSMVPQIIGGLLILFSMWWLYFDHGMHDLLTGLKQVFIWGYMHYLVFAAAAAAGAGLAVVTDVASGHAAIGMRGAGWAVAGPVALYIACLWFLHRRPRDDSAASRLSAALSITLVMLTPFTPSPVLSTGLVLAGLLTYKLYGRHRAALRSGV